MLSQRARPCSKLVLRAILAGHRKVTVSFLRQRTVSKSCPTSEVMSPAARQRSALVSDPAAPLTEGLPPPASPHNATQRHLTRPLIPHQPIRSRRKPPILRLPYQPLATRVVMQIIQLRLPELLRLQLHRMPARLPETPLPIRARFLCKNFAKNARQMLRGKIRHAPASKLAKVSQRLLRSLGREALVEEDPRHMSRHDDIGIDAQSLVLMAVKQTFRDDLASLR